MFSWVFNIFIHFENLWLLVGIFKTFTFSVIAPLFGFISLNVCFLFFQSVLYFSLLFSCLLYSFSFHLVVTLRITTWFLNWLKSNKNWCFYLFPDNPRILENFTFIYPLPTHMLLLSCIFILYVFKPTTHHY